MFDMGKPMHSSSFQLRNHTCCDRVYVVVGAARAYASEKVWRNLGLGHFN